MHFSHRTALAQGLAERSHQLHSIGEWGGDGSQRDILPWDGRRWRVIVDINRVGGIERGWEARRAYDIDRVGGIERGWEARRAYPYPVRDLVDPLWSHLHCCVA